VLRGLTWAKAILPLAVFQPAGGQVDPALARLFPAQPAGYVTDVAEVLAAASESRIAARAERLREVTGAELAVVVLPTIGDRAAVDVAVAIGRAWGVGANARIGDQRRNAGLVILLVPRRADDPNSGQIFIATGNGLEGIVTDLHAGRVRDLMRPYFQRGDYAGGLETGVAALASHIAQGMGVSDSLLDAGAQPLNRRSTGARPGLIVAVIVLIILLAVLSKASRRGPPSGPRGRGRRRSGFDPLPWIFLGGLGGRSSGGGFGGFGGGGGGFGGFGGGGGFSGGGAGGRF
jgi:uncharacterized protein